MPEATGSQTSHELRKIKTRMGKVELDTAALLSGTSQIKGDTRLLIQTVERIDTNLEVTAATGMKTPNTASSASSDNDELDLP